RGLLIDVYRRIDPEGCAVAPDRQASSLNPGCPRVRDDRCAAYRDLVDIFLDARQPARARQLEEEAMQRYSCAPDGDLRNRLPKEAARSNPSDSPAGGSSAGPLRRYIRKGPFIRIVIGTMPEARMARVWSPSRSVGDAFRTTRSALSAISCPPGSFMFGRNACTTSTVTMLS